MMHKGVNSFDSENTLKQKAKKITNGMKPIDGRKLNDYILKNDINKKEIEGYLGVSRSFLNDACRFERVRASLFNLACDKMGVNRDYFDVKEEEPEEKKEENIVSDHDILVNLLLTTKSIEALLLSLDKKISLPSTDSYTVTNTKEGVVVSGKTQREVSYKPYSVHR